MLSQLSKVTGYLGRALVALVVLLSLSGCPKKASWLPNENGGYTLMTQAESVDQAVVRFRRSAEELCGKRYALSPPSVTSRGWSYGPGFAGPQGGTTITMKTDLVCQ